MDLGQSLLSGTGRVFESRVMRKPLKIAAICAAALVLSFSAATAQGNAQNGAKLAAANCNACHSIGAGETVRKADAGPQFAELAKKSSAYLAVAINKPHDFMPKFPDLSKQDKDDLIAYIKTVK